MKNFNIGLFWCFTNIPDITAMFIVFQSADYVRNQVDTNSEKSKLWIFRNFVCLGKEFFQFSGQDFDPRCHECRTQWSINLFIEFYYWNIYFLKQSSYCWAYIDTDFHFTTKRRVYWVIRLRTFQTGEAITASGINVYRSQSGFICFLNYFLVYIGCRYDSYLYFGSVSVQCIRRCNQCWRQRLGYLNKYLVAGKLFLSLIFTIFAIKSPSLTNVAKLSVRKLTQIKALPSFSPHDKWTETLCSHYCNKEMYLSGSFFWLSYRCWSLNSYDLCFFVISYSLLVDAMYVVFS